MRAALGITTAGQAAGKWLTLAPVALIGAAVVPIVAWSLSGLFPTGLARRAEPKPGLRFDTGAVVVGAATTLAVTLILTAAMAWIGSRRQLRPAAHQRASPRLFARPAVSLGASFAVDPGGTGRSRVGSLATVAAIALGVAAVLAVTTLDWSRAHLTSTPTPLWGCGRARQRIERDVWHRGDRRTDHRHTRRRGGVHAADDQRRHDAGYRARAPPRSSRRPSRRSSAELDHRCQMGDIRKDLTRSSSAPPQPRISESDVGEEVTIMPSTVRPR